MTEKELTLEELEAKFNRAMELHDAEIYYNGSIMALESLRRTFIESKDKSITVKELVEELIPGFIKVVIEEHEALVKEIEGKSYVKDKATLN